jgi:hypothetical protein
LEIDVFCKLLTVAGKIVHTCTGCNFGLGGTGRIYDCSGHAAYSAV